MTDIFYATARKPSKQHRTLSFNPQSSFKQTQQTNTHNKSSTKRKTPSKRYLNINESQINKTIDFSSFKTHKKTLSVGKQNEFIALPQIQIAKNKRGAKKGSYLQIWLNQALDEGQGNQNFLTNLNDQTLGSLKKYGIDRKLLKAKNISQQTIDKIYKKLYVYSKGLGMTFQQIGKLATMKSPYEQNNVESSGNQIIEIFWKAFSKIMQNETPYESAFQVMQKNYLKTIQQLKLKMHGIGQQISTMQKDHSDQKRRLQRELQMLTVKYKHLQNEFNVNKSTLQLTQKSFDEQVELRLKFEQKINSVYTSYNEIKSKYAALVEQLGIKKQLNSLQQKQQQQLKSLLQKQETKCRQLQYLLSLEKQKVQDLHTQLLIKKQQRADIERQILDKQQQSKKQQDQITEYIQKYKLTSSLLKQSQNEMTRLKQILQEQKQVNKKLQKRIEGMSDLNNRLYQDKYKAYEQAQIVKEKNLLLTKEDKIKQHQIQKLNNQVQLLKQQLSSVTNQLTHIKSINTDLNYQLSIKTNLLSKANQNLTKLKQIKDRHQRLQLLAQHKTTQTINQNITLMSKLQQLQLQSQNLKNQIIQKQQQKAIQVTKLNKSKQLLTKKITTLEQHINKKDQSILTHLNNLQIQRIHMLKKQRQINQIKQKMQTRQHLIYKLQSQSTLLATTQPLIEQLLRKKQQQLHKMTQLNISSVVTQNALKSKIEQIQLLLRAKSNQINIQVDCYKRLSQTYKQLYYQTKQHIHPMVYQDLLAYVQNIKHKMQQLNKQMNIMKQQHQQSKQTHYNLTQQSIKLKQQTNNLNQQIKTFNSIINTLQQQNQHLRKNLKQQINKSLQLLQHQKILKSSISNLNTQKLSILKSLEHQKKQNQLFNQQLSSTNDKLKQLQKNNAQITLKYQQKCKQFQVVEEKLVNLKAKLNKFSTPKQNTSVFVQTDPIKQQHLPIPIHQNHRNQFTIKTPPQPLKPTSNQLQYLQSKQITQSLIQHSFQPTIELKRQQKNQQLNKFMKQTQKQQKQTQKQKQKPPNENKKKVQKHQFKRALKLTFMRR